jgi:hypothetical protein
MKEYKGYEEYNCTVKSYDTTIFRNDKRHLYEVSHNISGYTLYAISLSQAGQMARLLDLDSSLGRFYYDDYPEQT